MSGKAFRRPVTSRPVRLSIRISQTPRTTFRLIRHISPQAIPGRLPFSDKFNGTYFPGKHATRMCDTEGSATDRALRQGNGERPPEVGAKRFLHPELVVIDDERCAVGRHSAGCSHHIRTNDDGALPRQGVIMESHCGILHGASVPGRQAQLQRQSPSCRKKPPSQVCKWTRIEMTR